MKGVNRNVIEPPHKKFDIEVFTITHSKNKEIFEQKVFYDLVECK